MLLKLTHFFVSAVPRWGLGRSQVRLFAWRLLRGWHCCCDSYVFRSIAKQLQLKYQVNSIPITDGVTVKYIYGPATVNATHDNVIGSSINGRLEAGIGLSRLTTIAMPMKGKVKYYHYFHVIKCLSINLFIRKCSTITTKEEASEGPFHERQ